jgi:hypothetical protein
MRDLMYHWIVGNDVPPWCVAAARGLLGAVVVGGIAFFNAWAQTDDIADPFVIRTTGLAVLAWIGVRAGIEGVIDTRKNGR